MDTSLKVFNWQEQHDLTTITDKRDGSLWFVGHEVCKILDIGNTAQALSYLDADERTIITDDSLTTSRNPKVSIINESGLYSLIMRSRKPDAKVFKRWVTGEVLPTIRKTGAYLSEDTAKGILDDPETAVTLERKLPTDAVTHRGGHTPTPAPHPSTRYHLIT